MRTGIVASGEWVRCIYRPYDKILGEALKVGTQFFGKQTSVADLVAFQTKKGATTEISNPLTGLDSIDVKFELYTTSDIPFEEMGEVDVFSGRYGKTTYTIHSISELKDSAYAIRNLRTGMATFPLVLRLN